MADYEGEVDSDDKIVFQSVYTKLQPIVAETREYGLRVPVSITEPTDASFEGKVSLVNLSGDKKKPLHHRTQNSIDSEVRTSKTSGPLLPLRICIDEEDTHGNVTKNKLSPHLKLPIKYPEQDSNSTDITPCDLDVAAEETVIAAAANNPERTERRRAMDRAAKQRRRQNPDIRAKESESSRLRMQRRRADPSYKTLERERDKLRKRQKRQHDPAMREMERKRDRELKKKNRAKAKEEEAEDRFHDQPSTFYQDASGNRAVAIRNTHYEDLNSHLVDAEQWTRNGPRKDLQARRTSHIILEMESSTEAQYDAV